ncbi:MAG: O-antigen ligase [Candidatus Poriferisodalaceae bacterium]|jgi:O-antigen ligase
MVTAVRRTDGRLDITDWLMLIYIGSLPIEAIVRLPGVGGSLSRPIGLLTIISAVVGLVGHPYLRRPTQGHVLMVLFTGWCALSLTWTASVDLTVSRLFSFGVLLALMIIIHDRVRTMYRLHQTIWAFVIGAGFGVLDVLVRIPVADSTGVEGTARIGAAGQDVNEFSMTIALAAAAALLLRFLSPHRWVRLACTALIVLTPLVAFLAGSKGAILVLVPILIVILISSGQRGAAYLATALTMLAIGGWIAVAIAPTENIERIEWLFNRDEQDYSVDARSKIAERSQAVFLQTPVQGIGAGAFNKVAEDRYGEEFVTHSTPLSVAAETGIVGVAFFYGALFLAARAAWRGARQVRLMWLGLLAAWFVASATLTLEYTKVTWFVLSLVLTGVTVTRSAASNQMMGPNHLGARPIPTLDRAT